MGNSIIERFAEQQGTFNNCLKLVPEFSESLFSALDTFSDYGHIPENMRTFTGGENEAKELVLPALK